MTTPEELKLIEKILRAKIRLEGARRQHTSTCVVESDPEGYSPCNCGATEANRAIEDALRELKL